MLELFNFNKRIIDARNYMYIVCNLIDDRAHECITLHMNSE